MNDKWIGVTVLVITCLGLGLIAIISAIQGFRRGEFHHRSTWFIRSQDKTFFRVLMTITLIAGIALILFGVIFAFRILLHSES